MILSLVLFCSLCLALPIDQRTRSAVPSPVQPYLSDNSGARLKPLPQVSWSVGRIPESLANETLAFDLDTKHQVFDGVGGSFLRSGAIVLNQLPKRVQEELLTALFHPRNGAGFSLGKVPIAATDFMPPTWYTYADYPAYDKTLSNFSIKHDETINGTVQYIKRAAKIAGKQLRLESTMDYAPWWMLNSSVPLPGADLNTTLLDSLALYYQKFYQAFASHGIPIEFLSLFNELGGYTDATFENVRDLLVNHVGPLFRKHKAAPKVTWTEEYGRFHYSQVAPAFFEMSGIRQFTDVIFYHGYDCGDFGGWTCQGLNATCPRLFESATAFKAFVRTYAPGLKLWMTELCYATEFGDYPLPPACPPIPRIDFDDAMQWGRMIFADFVTVGASGWIYWNMILDTTGGPWLISPEHNDPILNPQQPVVVADPANGKFYLTGVYYALAHLGRYVPQGSIRVELSAPSSSSPVFPTNLYAIAFVHNDSQVVVWLMNDSSKGRDVTLALGDYYATIHMTPVSLMTVEFKLQ